MQGKRVLAALPAGKFFDRLHAGALIPWAQARGADLARLEPAAGSIGTLAQSLESADLVLAEISGRHPRVMHLAGYAQGIGKRVVFLCQFEEDFPFERGQQTVIVHSGDPEFLRQELDALDNPASSAAQNPADARERFLAAFGDIMRKHGQEHRGGFEMENPSTFILRDQDLDLALVQELSRRARELGLRIKLM